MAVAVALHVLRSLRSAGLDFALPPRCPGCGAIVDGDHRFCVTCWQSLEFLGSWGRRLTVFANGTKLELSGKSSASFGSFVPKSASWGVAFSYKRISMNARWNYNGLIRGAPQASFGPEGYEYQEARTPMDFNAGYQISRRFSLNLSVNNVFNTPRVYLRCGPETPGYARQYNRTEFGTRLAVGLKGAF